MNRSLIFSWLLLSSLLIGLSFSSCKEPNVPVDPPDPIDTSGLNIDGDIFSGWMQHEINPSGRMPQSARFNFQTKEEAQITVNVSGDYEYIIEEFATEHQVPILGVHPSGTSAIVITASTASEEIESFSIDLEFDVDLEQFPTIDIQQQVLEEMEEGWHLCDFIYNDGGSLRSMPFMFDNDGRIRWFIDFSESDNWVATISRLENGNWLNGFANYISEFDELGFEVNRWDLSGISQHHDVKEMADGNLLIAGSVPGLSTGLDVAFVLDRISGTVLQEYDIKDYMDIDRLLLTSNISDWYHMNAVWDDPVDGSVIISGKHQGIVHLSSEGALRYIIAPHYAWGQAGETGNGLDPNDYLLTAIDNSGQAYPDSVQLGLVSAADFDWPYSQHAVMMRENGNILVFDNGSGRNFNSQDPKYSRAVEYEVNEADMTIRQVWTYGKEEYAELFAPIISDVDILPQTGNILMAPGIIYSPYQHSRILELTYPDNQILFDAELRFDEAEGGGWGEFDFIYRAERSFPFPKL